MFEEISACKNLLDVFLTKRWVEFTTAGQDSDRQEGTNLIVKILSSTCLLLRVRVPSTDF